MAMKETFMFIRKHMGIGGIETYLYRTTKKFKKMGHRIIWIYPKGTYIDDGFHEEFMDERIEKVKVDFSKANWVDSCNIIFSEDEVVVAIAFNLYDFTFLEKIKMKYSFAEIHNFFWAPHFKGKGVFIEEFVPFLRCLVKHIIRKTIIKMDLNNNIIYVNRSHLDAFMKNYSYVVHGDYNDKLLRGNSREVPDYDIKLNTIRSKRDGFNIITVGRFSFPHKAYVLGLIRTYGRLKTKYEDLSLTIVGYGEDEDKVIEEIRKLPIDIQKDINFVGKVPYDCLKYYFNKSHLNVGVAGTIADGALTGLISIPVRHYSYECEGYGYLPESRHLTTSSKPGIPIEYYIEKVINMSESEYLDLSKKSYHSYSENKDDGFNSLIKRRNMNYHKTISPMFISFISCSYRIAKFLRAIKNKFTIRKYKVL